jgi:hypothetical protein
MPYHIVIGSENPSEEPVFERLLGSAKTLDAYWEEIARLLSLPTIVSMMDRADSENGFILDGEDVGVFKRELEMLEHFWKSNGGVYCGLGVPENFFESLAEIRRGVDLAIESGFKVRVS